MGILFSFSKLVVTADFKGKEVILKGDVPIVLPRPEQVYP